MFGFGAGGVDATVVVADETVATGVTDVTVTSASDSPVFSEMECSGGDRVSADGIITDI